MSRETTSPHVTRLCYALVHRKTDASDHDLKMEHFRCIWRAGISWLIFTILADTLVHAFRTVALNECHFLRGHCRKSESCANQEIGAAFVSSGPLTRSEVRGGRHPRISCATSIPFRPGHHALSANRRMTCMSAQQDGLVLGPASDGRFDSARFCCPVVHRGDDGWLLWYHGRDTAFRKGVYSQLTGRIGVCTSKDGIFWTRVDGEGELGSCLSFNSDPNSFDATHVGVGDVVCHGSGDKREFQMFYFGGSSEAVDLDSALAKSPAPAGTKMLGMRMRVGEAVSADGIRWTRRPGPGTGGALWELGGAGAWDSLFSAWPRVAEVGGRCCVFYSAFDPQSARLSIGVALAAPGDSAWHTVGVVVAPGPPGSFNERGSNRCHVVPRPQEGGYCMFLEGVNADNKHSIGVYESEDGKEWAAVSGTAVLEVGEAGAWDDKVLGWPYAVPMADGSCRLYYWGSSADGVDGIGVAESNGADWSAFTRRTRVDGIGVAESNGADWSAFTRRT